MVTNQGKPTNGKGPHLGAKIAAAAAAVASPMSCSVAPMRIDDNSSIPHSEAAAAAARWKQN